MFPQILYKDTLNGLHFCTKLVSQPVRQLSFLSCFFVLEAKEWLFLLGELGNKRQSLELCQYPPTE